MVRSQRTFAPHWRPSCPVPSSSRGPAPPSIALADQLIRAGDFDIVVAGGQESMTQAPHLLPKSRSGFKYGDVTLQDHMAHDGLFCAFDQVAMGASTEKHHGRSA